MTNKTKMISKISIKQETWNKGNIILANFFANISFLREKDFPQLLVRYLYTVPKIRFMYSQKLSGLVPNSYIHESVSNLYIPRIWLQQIRQTDPKNIEIACRQNIVILFWN